LLISEITARELESAPLQVRRFVADLPGRSIEIPPFTTEMAVLRDAYMSAGVVDPQLRDDAAHVAVATVVRADLMIFWNLRHLVKWEKIRAFNAVNLKLGYPMITILSPR
jgi:hypothetical protein